MGRLGKLSRLLHKHLGASGTFIGLEDHSTAFGQITEAEVDFYHLQAIRANSKIGGIIGGEQVEHSLGLKFYYDYFRKNNLDAFYFPFVVNELPDFRQWLDSCRFKDKFYGFSITMPYKKSFIRKTINLYIPNRDFYLNTDQEAFYKALDANFITLKDTILVVGSGAMAKTALSVFKGFQNLTLTCRNISSGQILTEKFNCDFLKISQAKNQSFDLLINCTALGMNGEDFIQETGICNFKKVIDLPYHEGDTKLIEFCKNHEIPFIDGKQFWQWQAKRQLEEFMKEIKRMSF